MDGLKLYLRHNVTVVQESEYHYGEMSKICQMYGQVVTNDQPV